MFRKLVEDIELWHGNDGRGYATIEINDHREHWPVLGGAFAKWLRLRAQLNGEPMLGAMEIGKLTENLEARCLLLGQLHNICHRVGWHDGKIYVDLADDQWRAVEIVPAKPDTTQRWRIVDRPPVRLLRTSGMRSMPAPAPGGTIVHHPGGGVRDFVGQHRQPSWRGRRKRRSCRETGYVPGRQTRPWPAVREAMQSWRSARGRTMGW